MPALAPLSLGPGRGGKLGGDVEGGYQKLLERRGRGRREEATCCRAPPSRRVSPEERRVVHRPVRFHPAPVLRGSSTVGNIAE